MRIPPTPIFSALLPLALIGLAAAAPRPAKKIDYLRDVKPILQSHCYACHGNGSRLGEFQIDSREGVLAGGQDHPGVVPGHSKQSLLIKLVSGQVPGKIMPARGPRLTTTQIAVLRGWIDEGVPFDAAGMAALWRPPLAPRRPKLPSARPGSGLTNPIDLLLQPYFAARKIAPRPVVDDRTYARRVFLDTIGLLPTPAEVRAFLNDPHPDKRARLAQRLLGDNEEYAVHWLSFWNDLLRNDYVGTGYIDGGRKQITGWLYNALATNMPYDRFVSQLVNPIPESEGFTKGIVWRGVVNASQTPQMQAAQNISQVFEGVNLKCASCHNSFINTWKLTDSYGMAGIYADHPLETVRCDKPTGQIAPIQFIYPQLGKIDGSAPPEQRRAQLAAILTSKANGRLARTFVNRIWARLMGRGLVEPADEMDNRPWNPDLLDYLASDFADNGYDVRRLIERIVTSRAYQLPSMGLKSEQTADFVFSGPVVKRMTAEQFEDAVAALTGVWPKPASQFQIRRGQPILPAGGRAAVKFQSGLMRSGSVDIDVDLTGAEVLSLVVTDGGNGANLDWADWADPRLVGSKGEVPLTTLSWQAATAGYGQVQIDKSIVGKPLRLGDKSYTHGIGTHANSVITYLLPPGVTRFRATAGPDTGAVEQKGSETSIELFVVAGDRSLVETRAAQAVADPLQQALGRPNRDQVVTERPSAATTLAALELTNGQTLNGMLAQGAARWVQNPGTPAPALVNSLYQQALGRQPTPAERQTALQMVGSPVRQQGVEDLLWVLVMLPEFQLVY